MKKRNMKYFSELMCFFLAFAITDIALADNHTASKAKAEECVSCHGPLGKSELDLWPNLAGQKQAYLILQLTAFRDGTRFDHWMTPMAVDLTDKDIDDLAVFYSNL